jgi:NAD(P)-dependent dehydrogenase (short-subunit alcohol dehydrogenase family)
MTAEAADACVFLCADEAVNPGYVAAPLTLAYLDPVDYAHMTQGSARVPAGSARVPAERMAEPEKIAVAILCLASDEASHINGIELMVDSGTTANLYIVETLPSVADS